MILKVLDLSTSHIKPDKIIYPKGYLARAYPVIDWGPFRVTQHEYGWIIFMTDICIKGLSFSKDIPKWLWPIIKLAIKEEVSFINFDQDGKKEKDLPVYDW